MTSTSKAPELASAAPGTRTPGATRHGVSVVMRDGDRIFRSYPAYARGAGPLVGTCAYPGLTPLGMHRYATDFPHHDTHDAGS
jgi:predicted dithiol-disulfide oxidoreductase (DUF899 family)